MAARFMAAAAFAVTASMLSFSAAAAAPKSFLETAETLRNAGFEGVIAVGDRNGPVISATSGRATPKRKHHIDNVWPWGSVTKQVTAVLIMQEVERGALALDQSAVSALPGFKGAPGVTIRQLLQHTSGLANPETGPKEPGFEAPKFHLRPLAPKHQSDDALGYCAGTPAAAAGARFDYNNCDYIVLGAILERLTGKSYAELVRTRIAEPLGLKSVSVAPRKRTKKRDVIGRTGNTIAPPLNEATYGAGGAVFGAAEDLLAFDRALLEGSLVSAESLKTLWTADQALGYAALGQWVYPATLNGCAAPVTLVERRGAIGGVETRNVIAPEQKRMLVAFTNNGAFDFGEISRGEGAAFDLASAAFCARG